MTTNTPKMVNAINSRTMTIEQILLIMPGVNLRQIKQHEFGTFSARHFDESKGDVKFTHRYITGPYKGKTAEFIRRPNNPHPLDGKWVAMVEVNTGSLIRWSSKSWQMGDTPLEALEKLLAHNNKQAHIQQLVEDAKNEIELMLSNDDTEYWCSDEHNKRQDELFQRCKNLVFDFDDQPHVEYLLRATSEEAIQYLIDQCAKVLYPDYFK